MCRLNPLNRSGVPLGVSGKINYVALDTFNYSKGAGMLWGVSIYIIKKNIETIGTHFDNNSVILNYHYFYDHLND